MGLMTRGKKSTHGRMRLRATWLATRSVLTPFWPTATATMTEGTSPISRVTSRLTNGEVRQLRKPSETHCPANVTVMLAAWPDMSSEMANR